MAELTEEEGKDLRRLVEVISRRGRILAGTGIASEADFLGCF